MVPALKTFSMEERDASKHALGMLLKYVVSLQIADELALTISEQAMFDRAQATYLATSGPNPQINFGESLRF
jgi:hypothetical protein